MKKFNMLIKNNLFLILILVLFGRKNKVNTQEGIRVDALPFLMNPLLLPNGFPLKAQHFFFIKYPILNLSTKTVKS